MPEKAAVLTDADFDGKTSSGVALVDFWATWCPPCRMQGPIVEKIAEAYAGRVFVAKLDVDSSGKVAGRLGIQSIPTLILFKDGKEVERMVGLQPEQRLRAELDKALGM